MEKFTFLQLLAKVDKFAEKTIAVQSLLITGYLIGKQELFRFLLQRIAGFQGKILMMSRCVLSGSSKLSTVILLPRKFTEGAGFTKVCYNQNSESEV